MFQKIIHTLEISGCSRYLKRWEILFQLLRKTNFSKDNLSSNITFDEK